MEEPNRCKQRGIITNKLRARISKRELSKTLNEAVKIWLDEKEQEQIKNRLKELLGKGFAMGKILYHKNPPRAPYPDLKVGV